MDEGGKSRDSSEGDGGGNEHGRHSERDEEGEEEAKCKAAIEVEKKVYKGSFQVRWRRLHKIMQYVTREVYRHQVLLSCQVLGTFPVSQPSRYIFTPNDDL